MVLLQYHIPNQKYTGLVLETHSPIQKMETRTLKQDGHCNFCGIETEEAYYIFCSTECRNYWLSLEGKQMGQYDIDKDLYLKWFEDKTIKIAEMKTKEEIEKRIIEIYNIEFYCKREWAMLHQQWDKIAGRKGIPPHIKEERDRLITDPNIQVNWEGEPRKKEKKTKDNVLQSLLGINIKELTQQLKEKNGGFVAPEKPQSKQTLEEALSAMATATPKEEPKKLTADELKSKAEQVKEKIRLAKEKREAEKNKEQ